MQGNDKYERFLFRRPFIEFAPIFVYCRAILHLKAYELCCLLCENSVVFVPNGQTF